MLHAIGILRTHQLRTFPVGTLRRKRLVGVAGRDSPLESKFVHAFLTKGQPTPGMLLRTSTVAAGLCGLGQGRPLEKLLPMARHESGTRFRWTFTPQYPDNPAELGDCGLPNSPPSSGPWARLYQVKTALG